MNTTNKEEQRNILNRMDATKGLIESVEKISEYKSEIDELREKNNALKDMKTEEKKESEKRISDLNQKISKLEADSLKNTKDNLFIKDGKIQIGNPNFIDQTSLNKYGLAFTPSGSVISTGGRLSILSGLDTPSSLLYANTITCSKCLKTQYPSLQTYSHIYGSSDFNKCSVCEKYYCSSCWPKGIQLASGIKNDKCPDCSKKI
jgi:FtsZ-binding cell division protein ZapB